MKTLWMPTQIEQETLEKPGEYIWVSVYVRKGGKYIVEFRKVKSQKISYPTMDLKES